MGQPFGDTTLTKVFVGGLAWETQKEALREHFDKYGDILEAVIISDKTTGRSKGYGFVTFKEPEAARKACEDAAPVINGRRANCNLASLGAKRGSLRPSPPTTPTPPPAHGYHPPPGMAVESRVVSTVPPAAPWSYPHPSGTPFQLHWHGVLPFYAAAAYGYPPDFVTELGYNAFDEQKLGHTGGGGYFQGPFPYPAQGGMVVPNGMMPIYPLYYLQYHQAMGVHYSHCFPTTNAATGAAMTTIPTISKPTTVSPPLTTGGLAGKNKFGPRKS
ncbi:hypothetical protein MUK42_13667 [Musa troglodytarum]|uniref:RRM domain-containing protein n=1 Tax=Musa troglodytarum TaxID=320322 RepID=A0A9E7IK91_9LILI|nr:hypothetical protein MUK42_13667 [Musa troglodytarum]